MSARSTWVAMLALLAAAGCDRVPTARIDLLRYQRALVTATEDPEAGWDGCATLVDRGLAGDCRIAVVEQWAGFKGTSTEALLARCATLEPAWQAQECAFQVGERRRDASACAQAGGFADDCRMHLATASFDAWMPKDARVDDPALHQRMVAEATAAGVSPDDPRIWSAFFRRVLAQQPSVDRGSCRSLLPPLAEACLATGMAHYHDRLNMARDQGLYPCDGGPLPGFLRTDDDPELDALRAERLQEDLCSPQAGTP